MKEKLYIFFTCAISTLLLLFLAQDIYIQQVSPNGTNEFHLSKIIQSLKSSDEPTDWIYLDADLECDADTLPASVTSPNAPWKPYGFPDQPPLHTNGQNTIWLRFTLPDALEPNDALFFDAIDQSFHIWIDDQLVYKYHETGDLVFTYGRQWHVVPLPIQSAGKVVTIASSSSNSYQLGVFGRFLIRTVGMSYLLLLIYDLPFILGIAVASILILCSFVYIKDHVATSRVFQSFIFFLIIFIVWMISTCNYNRLFIPSPSFWWDLHIFSVYLILPVWHYMLVQMTDEVYARRLHFLIIVHILIFFIVLIIDFITFDGFLFYAQRYYIQMSIVGGVFTSYWIYRSGKNGNPYSIAIALPSILCLILCALDALSFHYRLWPRTIFYTAFTAPLFTIFLFKIMEVNVRKRIETELRIKKLDSDIKEARKKAQIDPLTQVFNRWKFEEAYQQSREIAMATDGCFSLLMFDIDHFKSINDTWGHETGDVVLQNFCQLLLSLTDRRHTLIRWGGEEFVLLCQHQDIHTAAEFANQICHHVASAKINPYAKVTCSVGVSTWHEDISDPFDLVSRADAALYRAKENGRNRVELESTEEA